MKNIGDYLPIIGPVVNLVLYYNTGNQIYLIIVFVLLIEIHFVSHIYKLLFYTLGLGSLRPKYNDKIMSDNPLIYNGMPSGHSSNITLFALLYYHTNNSYLFMWLIPIMMLQRILTKAHTLLQTIIGVLVGIIEYFIFIYVYHLIKNK
jgi:membrane-associated phospholipid phosphatase